MFSGGPPLIGPHLNRQKVSISKVERQIWDPYPTPAGILKTCITSHGLRLPVPSSVREGFGLFLIHHILCAGPEAHLKFLIPVDAPCGEHLAGWHTF